MKNFFAFLSKYHKEFLVIVLQAMCLAIFFSNNSFQRSVLISSSNQAIGEVYAKKADLMHYFNLRNDNEKLSQENAVLKSMLKDAYYLSVRNQDTVIDTVLGQQYRYYTAKAINTTLNLQSNYITLNKGTSQGIKPDMGVISPEGLVGVVLKSSRNFSVVLPVINNRFTSSVEIKRTNNFGLLKWDGVSPGYAKIEDIANHARIHKGDTVITRSSSAIYPTGIIVGIVDKIEHPAGTNYLDLTIRLAVDFSKITTVYAVDNLMKREQLTLEEETVKTLEEK